MPVERPGHDLVRQLVDRGGGEPVPRAQQPHQRRVVGQGAEAVHVGVALVDGHRVVAVLALHRDEPGCRERRSPRPSDTSRHPPSAVRRTGRRSRSGSSCTSCSANALGQMCPRESGSASWPRIDAIAPSPSRRTSSEHIASHRVHVTCRTSGDSAAAVIGGGARTPARAAASRPPGRSSCSASPAAGPARAARARRCAGRSADQVRPKSRLVGRDGIRRALRHLLEEPGRGDERLVVHLAGQPQLDGPLPADHLAGHRQPLGDVHPHLLRQRLDAAHVRDEPPAASMTDHWASAVVIRRSAASAICSPPP